MILQMSEEKKEEMADFVIENNSTKNELFKKLDAFYKKLLE